MLWYSFRTMPGLRDTHHHHPGTRNNEAEEDQVGGCNKVHSAANSHYKADRTDHSDYVGDAYANRTKYAPARRGLSVAEDDDRRQHEAEKIEERQLGS